MNGLIGPSGLVASQSMSVERVFEQGSEVVPWMESWLMVLSVMGQRLRWRNVIWAIVNLVVTFLRRDI
jgi:hypothetical protein